MRKAKIKSIKEITDFVIVVAEDVYADDMSHQKGRALGAILRTAMRGKMVEFITREKANDLERKPNRKRNV